MEIPSITIAVKISQVRGLFLIFIRVTSVFA